MARRECGPTREVLSAGGGDGLDPNAAAPHRAQRSLERLSVVSRHLSSITLTPHQSRALGVEVLVTSANDGAPTQVRIGDISGEVRQPKHPELVPKGYAMEAQDKTPTS